MKVRSFLPALMAAGAIYCASQPATAADMYRAPAGYKDVPYVVLNWSGLYAGVNGGYSFDSQNHPNMQDEGGFGGGQIGYNWQGAFGAPDFVAGVEADFQGAGIDHSIGITINNHAGVHRRAIDEFGTVRGRLGYAMGPTLLYFTGGLAYGYKQNEFTDNVTNDVYKDDGWKAGYVLGAGVEYKLNPAWSVKAEYQFVDLGHANAADAAGNYVRTIDTELSTVRMGLNYHLGAGYSPLK